MAPEDDERDGYVPNVVYSCGGLVVGEDLILPFGVADHKIGVARVGVAELVDSMTRTG
jgi:predicted GH43/DUF377 family glycosyl hydrolase